LATVLVQSGASAVAAASATAVSASKLNPLKTGNANLLQNGCLTDPQLSKELQTSPGLGPGQSSQLPGWTIGSQVAVGNSGYQAAAPGCPDFVFLDINGSISQVVSTTPGFSYLVQWELNAHHWGQFYPRTMKVFWEGRVVASRSINYTSNSQFWSSEQVLVTASEKHSELTLQDTTGSNGEIVSNVSVTAADEVVNGFRVPSSNGVYASTVRQMAAKIPGSAVVSASGTPVCALQATAAEQVRQGAGVLVIWTVAPTNKFVHDPQATRRARAQVVEAYLVGLLKRSRDLYLGLLQAGRIPPQGSAWWAVEVQSVNTIGSLMNFEVASAGNKTTMTWSNVPGVSSTKPALAPQALASLLYYTKDIAGV
jgi:hypothetical protein